MFLALLLLFEPERQSKDECIAGICYNRDVAFILHQSMGNRSQEPNVERKVIPEAERHALRTILGHLEGSRGDDPAFRSKLVAYTTDKGPGDGPDYWVWIAEGILHKYGVCLNAGKFLGRGDPWNVAHRKALRECLSSWYERGALGKVIGGIRRLLERTTRTR